MWGRVSPEASRTGVAVQGLHWDPPTISAEQSFSACTAGARLGQTPHAALCKILTTLPSQGAWKETRGQVSGFILFWLTQTQRIQEYPGMSGSALGTMVST